ncbi:very short patch repair endonuclease [Candidatus Omnitrophota bacterium]
MRSRSKTVVSYTMSRIRSKNTLIEKMMSSALSNVGLKGYRKHSKNIMGKPDFVWEKYKIAVFCDSAFWHGYKKMATKIHNFRRRKAYWLNKISKNIERDKTVSRALRKDGWKVIRFWDFQIVKNPQTCAQKIAIACNERTKK